MTGWWFQIFFIFTPNLGEDFPFWRAYFSNGWFNHQDEARMNFQPFRGVSIMDAVRPAQGHAMMLICQPKMWSDPPFFLTSPKQPQKNRHWEVTFRPKRKGSWPPKPCLSEVKFMSVAGSYFSELGVTVLRSSCCDLKSVGEVGRLVQK